LSLDKLSIIRGKRLTGIGLSRLGTSAVNLLKDVNKLRANWAQNFMSPIHRYLDSNLKILIIFS
jgi:hypothetical protein